MITADLRFYLCSTGCKDFGGKPSKWTPEKNYNRLATYQAWFATLFARNVRQTYIPLPWFRLRAHTLKVKSAVWHYNQTQIPQLKKSKQE
eukprot:1142532-Pelagomonas_calceolata.AAC.3